MAKLPDKGRGGRSANTSKPTTKTTTKPTKSETTKKSGDKK